MRPMNARRAVILVSLLALSAAASCSNDSGTAKGWTVEEGPGDETVYGDDSDVIIAPGDGDDQTSIISGDGEGCVELSSGDCVDPDEVKQEYCGDEAAQADIIVDDDGEVVKVICYPPSDDGTPIEEVERNEDGTAEVPQTDNGSVIIFSEDTNGEPIEGDVTLTAENVSLFGNGVDQTIIDGNLNISSNGSQARGLTVTGDVTIDLISNSASLAFCKIHGNLTVEANEVTVANCQVFGDVTVTGRNATLVNVGVQGAWEIAPSAYCDGCYSFSDDDDDLIVSQDEVGEDLVCDGTAANNVDGTPDNVGGTNNVPMPNNLPGM